MRSSHTTAPAIIFWIFGLGCLLGIAPFFLVGDCHGACNFKSVFGPPIGLAVLSIIFTSIGILVLQGRRWVILTMYILSIIVSILLVLFVSMILYKYIPYWFDFTSRHPPRWQGAHTVVLVIFSAFFLNVFLLRRALRR